MHAQLVRLEVLGGERIPRVFKLFFPLLLDDCHLDHLRHFSVLRLVLLLQQELLLQVPTERELGFRNVCSAARRADAADELPAGHLPPAEIGRGRPKS